jgi:hypothetical protein
MHGTSNVAPACHSILDDEQIGGFHRDGYLIVRRFLDPEQRDVLHRAAKSDATFQQHARVVKDQQGGTAKLVLWNAAGETIYGAIARSHRVVDAMEQLLCSEVYHYHSKMSIKEPFGGGAWVWHQDYGYWYQNGCLFPEMASVVIAIDPNTRQNGCMELLRGSHLMGRIEHGWYGEQLGADPERTEAAMKVLELVSAELDPGDGLFFHCNTLHRSGQNQSPIPRWSLLCCYNTRRNSPYKASPHPGYEKLEKVADARLAEMGTKTFERGTEFLGRPPTETAAAGKG